MRKRALFYSGFMFQTLDCNHFATFLAIPYRLIIEYSMGTSEIQSSSLVKATQSNTKLRRDLTSTVPFVFVIHLPSGDRFRPQGYTDWWTYCLMNLPLLQISDRRLVSHMPHIVHDRAKDESFSLIMLTN